MSEQFKKWLLLWIEVLFITLVVGIYVLYTGFQEDYPDRLTGIFLEDFQIVIKDSIDEMSLTFWLPMLGFTLFGSLFTFFMKKLIAGARNKRVNKQ